MRACAGSSRPKPRGRWGQEPARSTATLCLSSLSPAHFPPLPLRSGARAPPGTLAARRTGRATRVGAQRQIKCQRCRCARRCSLPPLIAAALVTAQRAAVDCCPGIKERVTGRPRAGVLLQRRQAGPRAGSQRTFHVRPGSVSASCTLSTPVRHRCPVRHPSTFVGVERCFFTVRHGSPFITELFIRSQSTFLKKQKRKFPNRCV